MQEGNPSHLAPTEGSRRPGKRSAPIVDTADQTDHSKPRKFKRFAGIFNPRQHSWIPWPLLRLEESNPESLAGTVVGPPGPGRRPFQWTDQLTRALIRLVIKTNISFDDIHAAIADQENNLYPTNYACRKRWQEIFGSPPCDCELKNAEGRVQRYLEHEKAYKKYTELKKAQRKTVLGEAANDGMLISPPPEIPLGLSDASQYAMSQQELSVPVDVYPTPFESRRSSITSTAQFDETRPANASHIQPGGLKEDATSGTLILKKGKGKPCNPEQVAFKYGIPLGQLNWYKRTRPQSWVSRISKRSSTQSTQATPIDNGTHQAPSNDLCYTLECARITRDFDGAELGANILKLLEQGADPNQPNEDGLMPLHIAVELGCMPAFCVLLDWGADSKARTPDGKSISTYARECAREPDVLLDTEAHIEWTKANLDYNPELEGMGPSTFSQTTSTKRNSNRASAAKQPSLDTVNERNTESSQNAAYSSDGATGDAINLHDTSAAATAEAVLNPEAQGSHSPKPTDYSGAPQSHHEQEEHGARDFIDAQFNHNQFNRDGFQQSIFTQTPGFPPEFHPPLSWPSNDTPSVLYPFQAYNREGISQAEFDSAAASQHVFRDMGIPASSRRPSPSTMFRGFGGIFHHPLRILRGNPATQNGLADTEELDESM